MPVRDLTERVTIQQASAAATQARARTWSTLATVWAAVRASGQMGAERVQAGAVRASLRYEVEIQYRADVTPKMRVSWTPYRAAAAKTLEIAVIDRKDGRAERLLLYCAEAA